MKLGLGAAQFGMNYGITNQGVPPPSLDEVQQIINYAENNEITFIDTAYEYGNSESILGEVLQDKNCFNVITKIPHLRSGVPDYQVPFLEQVFLDSLKKLRKSKLYAILIHNTENIGCSNEWLIEKLLNFKRQGKVEKVGISVYTKDELNKVLDNWVPDIVQIPINIFNQHFLENNYLQYLKKLKIEIHARSVFLQGVLLAPVKSLPAKFNKYHSTIENYYQELKKLEFSPAEVALGFIKQIQEIDVMLMGINRIAQLEELVHFHKKAVPIPLDFSQYKINDEGLIDPRTWTK